MWFLKTTLSLALLPLWSIAGYGGISEGIIHGSLRDANVFQHCRYDNKNSTESSSSSSDQCPLSSLDEPTLIYPGGTTRCAFDTDKQDETDATYRFQVHPGKGEAASNLLLFFQGGGVCLSPDTCNYIFNAQIEEKSGQPLFQTLAIPERDGFLREEEPRNPFEGWTKVVVIYCTGDVHLGNKTLEDTSPNGKHVHFNGAENTAAVLRWVFHNIHNPTQVFLAGSSAGAIGAQLWSRQVFRHYHAVTHKTFLSDSFPGFSTPVQGAYMPFFNACALFTNSAKFQQACTSETLVMSDFSKSVTREFPDIPFLYVASKSDEIQRMFYCVGIYRHEVWVALAKLRSCISPESYYLGVQAVMNGYTRLEAQNNVVSYIVDGSDHVIFPMNALYTTVVNNVALSEWVREFTWTNRTSRIIPSVCQDTPGSVLTSCPAKVSVSKYYGQDVRDQFVKPVLPQDNVVDDARPPTNDGVASRFLCSRVLFSVSTLTSVLISSVYL